MMACLALVGGLAALAAAWLVRHRRAAVAIACTVAMAGVAASEMTSARAVNLASFAAAILLLRLVPVISLVGVRIAGRAPAVLCAGLLATLTATLALVHRIRLSLHLPRLDAPYGQHLRGRLYPLGQAAALELGEAASGDEGAMLGGYVIEGLAQLAGAVGVKRGEGGGSGFCGGVDLRRAGAEGEEGEEGAAHTTGYHARSWLGRQMGPGYEPVLWGRWLGAGARGVARWAARSGLERAGTRSRPNRTSYAAPNRAMGR